MVYNHRLQTRHAQRGALGDALSDEFLGDDDRRWAAEGFEFYAVVQTARCARPSIADSGDHYVVGRSNLGDHRRIGGEREAPLHVVVDLRKAELLVQDF